MFTLGSTLLTTIGGTIIGAVKEIYLTKAKAASDERQMLLAAAGVAIKDRQEARQMANKSVQFTRRIIVIAFMIILLTPVYLVIMDPSYTFSIPVHKEESISSFLFGLFSNKTPATIEYIQVQGYVYLIAILDMVGFIIGFYFGSGGTQTRT